MAGQSTRDIQRRISSIKNTQQITRAMEIVAATKLRRAQQNVVAARPFSDKLKEVLGRLVAANRPPEASGGEGDEAPNTEGKARRARGRGLAHPLLEARSVKKVAYVLITADRGLAGGYNANLIRMADRMLREEERPFTTVAIGRKGRDFLRRTQRPMLEEHTAIGDEVSIELTRRLSGTLMRHFQTGEFDEVHLVYNMFINATTHRPVSVQLLPITGLASEQNGSDGDDAQGVGQRRDGSDSAQAGEEEGLDYIYEPSPEAVLNILLPRYVDTQVYRALLEAKAAEHGARMSAMRNATDNAGEMIRSLNLSYNRARQAGITTEISEIVGGAEALASG